MTTQTLTEPDVEQSTEQGPGRFAHYVKKGKIAEAVVMGTPVEALCGYVWVPSRDPKKLPVCPECQAIYDDNEAITLARNSM